MADPTKPSPLGGLIFVKPDIRRVAAPDELATARRAAAEAARAAVAEGHHRARVANLASTAALGSIDAAAVKPSSLDELANAASEAAHRATAARRELADRARPLIVTAQQLLGQVQALLQTGLGEGIVDLHEAAQEAMVRAEALVSRLEAEAPAAVYEAVLRATAHLVGEVVADATPAMDKE